jgi:hypothetical protein
MKHTTAAEECPVIHANVTAEQTIVGDDHAVSDHAIVTKMRTCHQKIFVADFCRASVRAPAMNRAVFANDILIANLNPRFSFRRERNVLRRRANNGAVSDEITGPDSDFSLNHDMCLHDRIVADHHFWSDRRKWTDFDIGADSRVRIENRRGMNLQSTPASLKLK